MKNHSSFSRTVLSASTPLRAHCLGRLTTLLLLLVTAIADQAAQFDPLSITGCKLWLKADAGITFSSGNIVSGWADQSVNNFNVGQITVANQPLLIAKTIGNGLPMVRFDGVNDRLIKTAIISTANNASMFVVCKSYSGGPRKVFDALPGSTTGAPVGRTTSLRRLVGWESATPCQLSCFDPLRATGLAASRYMAVSATLDSVSGNGYMYINGTQVNT